MGSKIWDNDLDLIERLIVRYCIRRRKITSPAFENIRAAHNAFSAYYDEDDIIQAGKEIYERELTCSGQKSWSVLYVVMHFQEYLSKRNMAGWVKEANGRIARKYGEYNVLPTSDDDLHLYRDIVAINAGGSRPITPLEKEMVWYCHDQHSFGPNCESVTCSLVKLEQFREKDLTGAAGEILGHFASIREGQRTYLSKTEPYLIALLPDYIRGKD